MSPGQGPTPAAEDKYLVDHLHHQNYIEMEALAVMETSDTISSST